MDIFGIYLREQGISQLLKGTLTKKKLKKWNLSIENRREKAKYSRDQGNCSPLPFPWEIRRCLVKVALYPASLAY